MMVTVRPLRYIGMAPVPIVREIKVYVPHEGVIRARGDVRRVLDRYGVKYDREAPYGSA